MIKINKPIIVFGCKKKRAIRRACGLIVASCLTNQNGKTTFNHQAANYYGLTFTELELIRSIIPKPPTKPANEPVKAKMEVKK